MSVASNEARQCHNPIFHCHRNVGRVDIRFPLQFLLDVAFDVAVGSHSTSLAHSDRRFFFWPWPVTGAVRAAGSSTTMPRRSAALIAVSFAKYLHNRPLNSRD